MEKIKVEICCGTACYLLGAAKLMNIEEEGAFRIRENAEAMVRKIKEAGFEAFVTETEA